MFFKKQTSIDAIIVGLGNPGKKYEGTRHNAGFAALDHVAEKWGVRVTKAKFDALTGTGPAAGVKVLLMKPQTFMNLSGDADDISLAPGRLRIRKTGSAGGHNGIKSIIGNIGQDFPRVKIGVGEKPRPEYDLADWVLSRLTQAEKKAVEARYDDICGALELMMKGQFDTAMSRYNG